jgi:hypothetical protein
VVIALRLGTSLRKGVRSCVFTKRRTVVRLYVRTKSHRNLLDVPSLRYTHVPSLRYKSHRYLLDVNPIRVMKSKVASKAIPLETPASVKQRVIGTSLT